MQLSQDGSRNEEGEPNSNADDQGNAETDSENETDSQSDSRDYITTSSPPEEARIIELPRYHGRFYTSGMECIYYSDNRYALCGYSDKDSAIFNRGPYPSREAAEDALLNDYGYGRIPGFWEELAGRPIGEYAKAYTFDIRFRWQGFVSCRNDDECYLNSDGPEPDPVYSILFHGGRDAVRDWHIEY